MSPRPACLSPSSSCISWLLGDLYQATSKPPPQKQPCSLCCETLTLFFLSFPRQAGG